MYSALKTQAINKGLGSDVICLYFRRITDSIFVFRINIIASRCLRRLKSDWGSMNYRGKLQTHSAFKAFCLRLGKDKYMLSTSQGANSRKLPDLLCCLLPSRTFEPAQGCFQRIKLPEGSLEDNQD